MKNQLQKGLILGMIVLSGNIFGQQNSGAEPTKNNRLTKTRFEFVLNLLTTNLNYGKANSSLADYKKSILSPQVGVSMQVRIAPRFTLVQELYFITKGGRLESNNPLTSSKTALRLYAMELPVLARFHIGMFHINAGPSIAYNFYGTQKIEGKTSDVAFNKSGEGFKRWEAGIQFGGGYTFHVRQKSVALDLRYNYGLTNISKTNQMYNRSLVVSAHLKPWKI
jgi:hypothetical protein